MKKIGMFMIVGALAWSLQACSNNNRNEDTMDNRDSTYMDGTMSPMNDNINDTSIMTDTTGTNMNGTMRTDTTGTNRTTP